MHTPSLATATTPGTFTCAEPTCSIEFAGPPTLGSHPHGQPSLADTFCSDYCADTYSVEAEQRLHATDAVPALRTGEPQ